MDDELDIADDALELPGGLAGEAAVGETAGYFVQVLAFRSIDKLAKRVYAQTLGQSGSKAEAAPAREPAKPPAANPAPVVLFAETDAPAVLAKIRLLRRQIEMLGKNAKSILSACAAAEPAPATAPPGERGPKAAASVVEPVSAGLTAAAGLVGGVADLVAFFKTDTTFSGRSVTLGNDMLLAELARVIRQHEPNRRVVVPQWTRNVDEGLFAEVEALMSLRSDLGAARATLEEKHAPDFSDADFLDSRVMRLETRLDSLYAAVPVDQDRVDAVMADIEAASRGLLAAREGRQRWERVAGQFDTIVGAIDGLIEGLTASAGTAPSVLERISAFLPFEKHVRDEWLRVQLVAPGGEVVVDSNTFRNDSVRYLAGAGCLYVHSVGDDPVAHTGVVEATKAGALSRSKMQLEEIR